ncbi:MAG: hypothetical protein ABII99_02555 [Patescibacteria group bacterium]
MLSAHTKGGNEKSHAKDGRGGEYHLPRFYLKERLVRGRAGMLYGATRR